MIYGLSEILPNCISFLIYILFKSLTSFTYTWSRYFHSWASYLCWTLIYTVERKKIYDTIKWWLNLIISRGIKRSRPSWPTWWNPVSTKNTKISQSWWCAPVVPATPEAEVGESLEPRRHRLQWAEITPLYSSPGDKSKCPQRKKKK